nr:16S rRNA (uracil(1498)-N(3))-methyltransferase [uncultured Blautia sp.]
MQRFFVEPYQIQEKESRITLTGTDLNHMKNVLRMRIGEEVWISDGSEKEYHCTIDEFMEDCAILHILEIEEAGYELPNRIYLFQGLPKGDKMELIIQKAVELGAYSIVPVEMKRCVVKLDAKKAQKKTVRWQQISESAAKQSKRMLIPEVKSVMSWREALAFAKELDVLMVPYELAKGMRETREIISSIKPGQSVGIFIGPEGGFEEEEIQTAMEMGAKPVTLGKRILRTETAGMTMLSVLMFTLEKEDE